MIRSYRLPRMQLAKRLLIVFGAMLLVFGCNGGGGGSNNSSSSSSSGSSSSCDCPNVSGNDTAANGSKVELESGTCMDPSPCSDANVLSVNNYNPNSLSSTQQSELNNLGSVYALLEIKPDGKTWDPAIQITVALLNPAPRDNFSLTIYRWASSSWRSEGTAIADKRGDMVAEGEISHTSLFAFVDTTAPSGVVIPDVIGLPIEQAAAILEEAGLMIGEVEEIEMEAEPGTVIDTDPIVGSEVEPGMAVNFVITFPPEEVPPPRADFTHDGDSGGCFFVVSFVNLSENADGFMWDFGDGQQSDEVNPTHEYVVESEGNYAFTVSLTAFGPGGSDSFVRPDYFSSICIQ